MSDLTTKIFAIILVIIGAAIVLSIPTMGMLGAIKISDRSQLCKQAGGYYLDVRNDGFVCAKLQLIDY